MEIRATELRAARAHNPSLLLLDVREPFEWEIAHIEGARLIPLGELPARVRELDGHAEIVTYCHHGVRSRNAAELLRGAGFPNVRSLAGGIEAWSTDVDRRIARY
jgi:adenylyltransferase/sulfurtransferase